MKKAYQAPKLTVSVAKPVKTKKNTKQTVKEHSANADK